MCFDVIDVLKASTTSKKWSAEEFRASLKALMKEREMLAEDKHLGRKTVVFSLNTLGFTRKFSKKQTYKDGHERSDVVKDRHDYTTRLFSLVDRMDTLEAHDSGSIVVVPHIKIFAHTKKLFR